MSEGQLEMDVLPSLQQVRRELSLHLVEQCLRASQIASRGQCLCEDRVGAVQRIQTRQRDSRLSVRKPCTSRISITKGPRLEQRGPRQVS
jgi:hypothetical protein